MREKPKQPRNRPSLILLGGAVLLLVIAALAFWRFGIAGQRVRLVAAGTEMMVDDFGFTLAGHQWSDDLERGAVRITSLHRFLILQVDVANHAKRVDFVFDPEQIFVESGDGRRFRLARSVHIALDPASLQPASLAPGESIRRELVYDVPDDATDLRMRVAFGGRMGEVLDWLFANMPATSITREPGKGQSPEIEESGR